jgi:acetyl-CoA acyltransferase
VSGRAVVAAALRTPFGRAAPSSPLAAVRGDDLSADLVRELVARLPVSADAIDDLVWGCVCQHGEHAGNLARRVALLAGLPPTVPGVTVQRACASGLDALVRADLAVSAGDADLIIAGGVEQMLRVPLPPRPDPLAGIGDDNPRLFLHSSPAAWNMGLTAEHLARSRGIGRAEQDAFALRSHRRSAAATFTDELLPCHGLSSDEGIRPDTSAAALAALPPAFLPGGTVSAGNASPLSIGAAALLVTSPERAVELGLRPLAAVRAWAVAGVEPAVMGLGPVPAVRRALARAGLAISDIDVWEINEAFAVQVLAVVRELGIDEAKVNVNGGALAIGHPLGASGARVAGTLAHELRRRGGGLGVATVCAGGGMGMAVVLEAG